MYYISPFRGANALKPIDILFGVLNGLPEIIISAKLCVDRLTGLCMAAPQIVPFHTFSNDSYIQQSALRADRD